MTDKTGRLKQAAKKAATDWSLVITVIAFSVTMVAFAHNLKDGSELKTTIVAGAAAFFGTLLKHLIDRSKQE